MLADSTLSYMTGTSVAVGLTTCGLVLAESIVSYITRTPLAAALVTPLAAALVTQPISDNTVVCGQTTDFLLLCTPLHMLTDHPNLGGFFYHVVALSMFCCCFRP